MNKAAQIKEVASWPKFRRPMERPPRMTVKFNQERKVRSLAKKTLGSTRVGRAMRLEEGVLRRGAEDMIDGCFGVRGGFGAGK